MKIKLDENLGPSVKSLFAEAGHDCHLTREEGLGGASDDKILRAAGSEARVLVTIDHDFGNVVQYPPAGTPGIAVLNPSGPSTADAIARLVRVLLAALATRPIDGRLWIVEATRVREHE